MVFSARSILPACAWVMLAACAGDTAPPPELPVREFEPLQTGEAQRDRLCGRGNADPVIDVFCAVKNQFIVNVASDQSVSTTPSSA